MLNLVEWGMASEQGTMRFDIDKLDTNEDNNLVQFCTRPNLVQIYSWCSCIYWVNNQVVKASLTLFVNLMQIANGNWNFFCLIVFLPSDHQTVQPIKGQTCLWLHNS